MHLLLIALAGAAGTLSRYGLSGLVQRQLGAGFPWGTASVNLAGSFLAGIVWTMCEERGLFSIETRAVLLVGFMGGFTTFSSFMLESGLLVQDAQWVRALVNITGQNCLGFLALIVGLALGRAL